MQVRDGEWGEGVVTDGLFTEVRSAARRCRRHERRGWCRCGDTQRRNGHRGGNDERTCSPPMFPVSSKATMDPGPWLAHAGMYAFLRIRQLRVKTYESSAVKALEQERRSQTKVTGGSSPHPDWEALSRSAKCSAHRVVVVVRERIQNNVCRCEYLILILCQIRHQVGCHV